MNFGNLIGQTIDGKYKIERQLGKGGMGTVYLATHVGTERPVAVKVIAPQFMERFEFVERFRREARAAGRLRHPNVVDVTDFGIAGTEGGKIAYLVMGYLDGCTLGEILDEEKQLPLSWSLDILEQVCSAVQGAHEQGIIHRDLKPDNIWLEPNQRGGYTVKVLDFGIAKLEEQRAGESENDLHISAIPTRAFYQAETIADNPQTHTIADGGNSTVISESGTAVSSAEAGTLIQKETDFSEKGTAILESGEIDLEGGTAILPDKKTQIIVKEDSTKLLSQAVETDESLRKSLASKDLTNVGAVLGTPLYMSPEQCRGEKLSSRSDIYSLGVIAYQMLGGKTPFDGDFTSVMQAHKENEPPRLEAKNVPKKVKQVIHSALAKSVDERPMTAEAFASILRANSEGIGALLRKAIAIYGEHLPKFLFLAFLLSIPVILLTVGRVAFNLLVSGGIIEESFLTSGISICVYIITFFIQIFSAAFMVGITTWIVAQILAVPLRPIDLRAAFGEAKKRWKPLMGTVTFTTLLAIVGLGFCIIPGIWLSARYMLVAPSIMMEEISGRTAMRRSVELVKRSFRTVLGTTLLVYFLPAILGFAIALAIGGMVKNFEPPVAVSASQEKEENINIKINPKGIEVSDDQDAKKEAKEFRTDVREGLFEIFWSPIAILIASFTSVITALIYFKTRQAGGESMQDLLAKFEAAERPRSHWQERVRERLMQSGRTTSKS